MLSYGKHNINSKDINNIKNTLKSDFLTQGPAVKNFENQLCKKFNSKYCSVVSSGTAALHLISKVLNWSKNDEVLCSAISFAASSNCILYSKAKVVFCDIDFNSFNLDLERVEYLLKRRKKIKSIVATDYAGNPNDWKNLKYLSKKYKVSLINDNCHAIGSKYFNDIGYATKYADLVTHSYHAVKTITTGEGGSVLTNNRKFDQKLKILRNHGIEHNFNKSNFKPKRMIDLGFNYRLPDILCSLGISQLSRLDKFVIRRRKIAQMYNKSLKNIENIKLQSIQQNSLSSYHLYPILVDFKKIKRSKKNIFDFFLKNKISLQSHYMPIYKHPYYQKIMKININNFKNSESFFKTQVSLPIYFDLKNDQVKKVIFLLEKFLR